MHRTVAWLVALSSLLLTLSASAQAPAAPPPFATTKLADNVYLFRDGGYQALFIVTTEGVIATDPIGLANKQAPQNYLDEIRKITNVPIRYVVYSHHHYDHITGGKPFKDAGATFVAHRNAQKRLAELKNPDIVLPDEVVDEARTINLGGTRVDLLYLGRNHSDNTLVVLLPKERILFAVDWLPVQAITFRDMPDAFIPDWFASIDRALALDWDQLVPGHPGPGGRLGTKDDVRAFRQYMTDLSDVARQLAAERKCLNDEAMRSVKLPKYEGWGGYGIWLFGNIERFCEYWGRGM